MRRFKLLVVIGFIGLILLSSWSIVALPLDPLLPFLGLIGVPLLIAAAIRPQIGVWVMLSTLWLAPIIPVGETLTLNRLIGITTLAGLLIGRSLKRESIPIIIDRFDRLCWAFFIIVCISVLFNDIYEGTFSQFWDVLMGYLLFFLIRNTTDTWPKFRQTAWVLLILSIVVSVSVYISVAASVDASVLRRVEGVQSVNVTGPLSVVGIILTLWLAEGSSGWRRSALYLALGVLAGAIFLSGNRSGVVALGVSAILLTVLLGVSLRARLAILITVVVVTVLVFSNLVPTAVERSFSLSAISDAILAPENISVLDSDDARFFLYDAAWRMFLDKPLFGIGFGGFPEFFRFYAPQFLDSRLAAHNMFLGTLAETGVVGFGLLSALYFEVVRRLWQIRREVFGDMGRIASYMLILLAGVTVAHGLFHIATISRLVFVIFASNVVAIDLAKSATATSERFPVLTLKDQSAR